ncbi:MAG TPA: hypothetical protein PLB91_02755 [Spirochaetales bacterium]|nr:hypothetical protein [Spirochaetales bacterium]
MKGSMDLRPRWGPAEPRRARAGEVVLIANGNVKQHTNRANWSAQAEMEGKLSRAFAEEGWATTRGHALDPELGHGFIWNQRMGIDVFNAVDPEARLVVAVGVWQFSQNILPGLRNHRGPILTVANWSGRWPGLVGLLNLNACLVKAGVPYSTIWSESYDDEYFVRGLRGWLEGGAIDHDASHVRPFERSGLAREDRELGTSLARGLRARKAIIGVFDEGCMGMYNAIVDDELLHPLGVYKERFSQSALVAAMRLVPDAEARAVRAWLEARGMRFLTGPDPSEDLTDDQICEQCKMYVAAVRMAAEFGCDAIGIQYSSGLKDMTPASDLAEGLMNNPDRPPVSGGPGGGILYEGQALPHFNEADECAGIDMLVNDRVWTAMGLDPSTTLHDVRWGERFSDERLDEFVWTFMISGAVPASHFARGYAEALSFRQPPVSFRLGGGTLTGVSKPGQIVWSRVFIEGGELHADIGRGAAVELPAAETERRRRATTPQWPLMHAVLRGVTRDQFMARHRANHVLVSYAPDAASADRALAVKSAMLDELGIRVHLCGI